METHILVTAVCISIVCVAASIISTHSIYHLCIKDSSAWIDKIYRNLTIMITLSFTTSTMTDLLHIILYFYSTSGVMSYDTYSKFLLPIVLIADVLYFIGDILFYILILLRIHVPFEISRNILWFLSFMIIIFAISSIVYCTVLGIFLFDPGYKEHIHYFGPLYTILIFGDFILNATIFIIFAKKMKRIISNVDPSLSDKAQRNVNLISNTVTKHCVLFGIAMSINQAFYAINLYERLTNSLWNVGCWTCEIYSIRAFENIVNIIVLWLVLRINYDKYICLCGCCHRCIGKCCYRDIASNVISDNPYLVLNDSEDEITERAKVSSIEMQ